jgi:hypothetical protein
MTIVGMKQLGPSGPPDHNRRSIVRFEKATNVDIEIIDNEFILWYPWDRKIGWTERDNEAFVKVMKVLKEVYEWPPE